MATKFNKVASAVAKEYVKKGMSAVHAADIGAAVAAQAGRAKLGAKAFNARAAKGRSK